MNKLFVAYFDILGYENRIAKKTISQEYDIQKEFVEGRKFFIEESKNIEKCGSYHFSDTHILYSINFGRIIQASLNFMVYSAIRDFPLRGAISYGDFLADNERKIIIGKALREAYKLEKDQNWMGCCLANSCCDCVQYQESFKIYSRERALIKYPVPFKNADKEMYAINMKYFYDKPHLEHPSRDVTNSDTIREIFVNGQNLNNLDPRVKEKMDKTIKFYDYIRQIESEPLN